MGINCASIRPPDLGISTVMLPHCQLICAIGRVVGRWPVRRGENGSPLGDRKRLAAIIAPQVQVMVRDQDDGKSVLVAIEAGEPLENRLRLLRLLGSKVHAASPLERDCHSAWYTDEIYARARRCATPLRERTRNGRAETG